MKVAVGVLILAVVYMTTAFPAESGDHEDRKHVTFSWGKQAEVPAPEPVDTTPKRHFTVSWRQAEAQAPEPVDPSPKKHHITVSWRQAEAHTLEAPDTTPKRHFTVSWRHGHPAKESRKDIIIIIVTRNEEATPHPLLQNGEAKEAYYRDNAVNPTIMECRVKEELRKSVKRYTWLRDGKVLDSKADPNTLSESPNGGVLTVKSAPENAGRYQCLAETDLGTASSQIVNFRRTFINAPTVATKTYTPTEGRPLELPCPIPEGYPKPEVFWVKRSILNSHVHPEPQDKVMDRRVVQSPEGSLLFSNVTQKDVSENQKLVCLAKSPAVDEPIVVTEALIEKVVPDTVANDGELVAQYLSTNVVALEGTNTFLYCVYGGTPLAHPDWFKDGKNVNGQPGDRVTRHNRSSGRRLLIQDTRASDAGTYTCEADNGVGKKQSHTITVTVEAAPKIVDAKDKLTAQKGQEVTVPLQAKGIPEPEKSWIYNGQPLATSDKISTGPNGITIKDFQASDQGYYGLRATNTHGDDYFETAVKLS